MTDLVGAVAGIVGPLLGDTSGTVPPALRSIINNVVLGAASAAILKAVNHPDVKSALLPFDPMNLAGNPAAPAPASAPAAATAAAPLKTLTLAQLASMGVSKDDALKAGYLIVS